MKFVPKFLVLALLTLTFSGVPAVYADGKCVHCASKSSQSWGLEEKFFHKAHFMLTNQEEMGLTDQQAENIKKLKIDVKKALIRQDAEIDVLALDIKAALYNRPVDAAALRELIGKKYDLKKGKKQYLADAYAQLVNGLDDQQYQQMKALWKSK